ncbi:HK97-gp10 family putative phage morphogenesis protein [Cytobacillus oceanisediminis]|uniref:HK97-gp10 family putative phage morphogenesis protein n=1 Tax=Cytobacillus oceanisediminis TaxID=665099 RepID=UPI002079DF24|nr:HK97-gp10 family putative phage morphogenesis protein [Cytobacillus oceanisediminis]MBY0157273.1 HK97 gp10 family phage protein [Cytobacillus firmus]USK44647.1 HK97 gp10 family phage protein [Cytobacillus oceanisediminis]USK46275.1 HK97 gp10 family phage protein [Cytobacillus oceanisediminis]
MANIRFGSRRLSRAVQRFGEGVIDEVKRIVVETAYMIQANARSLAPEDDGNLKNSIEVQIRDGGLTAVVTVGAHYAIYVEFGTGIYAVNGDGRQTPWTYYSDKLGRFVRTKGMRAQPYWFPAIEAGRRHFHTEMSRLVI